MWISWQGISQKLHPILQYKMKQLIKLCEEDVQWIQEQICKLTTISLEIDGLMGKKTEDAIRAYQ